LLAQAVRRRASPRMTVTLVHNPILLQFSEAWKGELRRFSRWDHTQLLHQR
jgi:hypothetical protein